MNDPITALLIGGTNHGAVIKLYADAAEEIQIAQRQKLKLVLPNHVEDQIAKEAPKDIYQKLTIDKSNQAIYVIKQDGVTANDIFVDYIFEVFIKGGK